MTTSQPILTFDEADAWLNEVAKDIPDDIYMHLNGGIVLLPDIRISPQSLQGDLYTLGTYFNDPYGLGRYIAIYYGSFVQVCRGQSVEEQKKSLRDVLYHELTHHLESLAGVRDLEVKDEQFMAEYREKKGVTPDKPPKRGLFSKTRRKEKKDGE